MSVKALSWAFEQRIGGNLKLLLLALADSHSDGLGCFPNIDTLISKACISRKTYDRLIVQLETRQYVERSARFTDSGRRTSNEFKLNFDGATPTFRGEGPRHVAGEDPDTVGEEYPGTLGVGYPDTGDGDHTLNVSNNYICSKVPFVNFYEHYPRKQSKGRAEKAWNKLNDPDRQAAIAGLREFVFSDDKKFIPLPASWLNDKRWLDEAIADDSNVDEHGNPRHWR
jgi:hypothetical protein